MEIEYIRQLQSSYMRIELSGELERTEEEMLTHNKIPGLLVVGWQREDKRVLLRYDISGKIALDALLEEKKADAILLERIFLGVCNTVKELEKYLLSPEGILLSPEAIFCDHKSGEVFFSYYPKEDTSLMERLQRFTEYLLTKTDHKNSEAVELAYGMYEELLKPAYNIKDIQDFLQERRLQKSHFLDLEEPEVTKEIEENDNFVVQKEITKKTHIEDWIEEKKGALKERLIGWRRKEKENKKELLFELGEYEEFEEGQETFATQLLSEQQEGKNRVLKYEGTDALPDLYLTRVPFLIGSAKDCDGIIKASGISRHHARIYYKEDTYFIEDMNSTNGTTVEGGLLTYKTKVSIRRGSLVCFANQPYRFL